MNKIYLLFGGGLALLLGIVVYMQSKRKVKTGTEYDLTPAGELFSLEGTAGANTDTANTSAPKKTLSIESEPAKSLVAQRMEIFKNSSNTMNDIRQRYGIGSNLFHSVMPNYENDIKQLFAEVFSINPDSLLSYPLWLEHNEPNLLSELEARASLPYSKMRTAKARKLYNVTGEPMIIKEWLNINFGLLQVVNGGGEVPELYPSSENWVNIRQFYQNAADEINRLEDAVKNEAAEYLRRKGYRFIEYGDTDAFTTAQA